MNRFPKGNILLKLLEVAPAGWSFIRVVEYELLIKWSFAEKVLDIGCGDGIFTKILLKGLGKKSFNVGLDASEKELEKVKKTGCYEKTVLSVASKIPYPDGYFSTVFSNGTLEHIGDIDKTLAEVGRVLKKGGRLIFTVPSSYFTHYLTLDFIPLYGKIFNRIFGHKNLFNHRQWTGKLAKNKMKIIDYDYYNPARQIRIHELLTLFGLGALLAKGLFGKWILFPKMRRLIAKVEAKVLGPVYDNSTSRKEGGSLLIVAQKK